MEDHQIRVTFFPPLYVKLSHFMDLLKLEAGSKYNLMYSTKIELGQTEFAKDISIHVIRFQENMRLQTPFITKPLSLSLVYFTL